MHLILHNTSCLPPACLSWPLILLQTPLGHRHHSGFPSSQNNSPSQNPNISPETIQQNTREQLCGANCSQIQELQERCPGILEWWNFWAAPRGAWVEFVKELLPVLNFAVLAPQNSQEMLALPLYPSLGKYNACSKAFTAKYREESHFSGNFTIFPQPCS